MAEKDITKKRRPDTVKRVGIRNGFYFAEYRNLIAAILIALITFVIGLGALYHFMTFTPPHKYIPTTPDFKVLVSPPLNEEYITESDAIQVATNALRAVYTYDHINWQVQIAGAQKYFTMAGWDGFSKELLASDIVKGVVQREQVVTIKIVEAPFVKQKGVSSSGQFTWYVVFPKIDITYIAPKANAKNTLAFNNYQAYIEVVRMPLQGHAAGAAVNALGVGARKEP
jgi:hypothetical protein